MPLLCLLKSPSCKSILLGIFEPDEQEVHSYQTVFKTRIAADPHWPIHCLRKHFMDPFVEKDDLLVERGLGY